MSLALAPFRILAEGRLRPIPLHNPVAPHDHREAMRGEAALALRVIDLLQRRGGDEGG
jgi:hypothetical protein